MSIPDYRECVWAELDKIDGATPDPENELQRLSTAERISIMSECPSSLMSVPDYRECVWAELAGIGVYQ